jgi:hypothetical protein
MILKMILMVSKEIKVGLIITIKIKVMVLFLSLVMPKVVWLGCILRIVEVGFQPQL